MMSFNICERSLCGVQHGPLSAFYNEFSTQDGCENGQILTEDFIEESICGVKKPRAEVLSTPTSLICSLREGWTPHMQLLTLLCY